MDELLVNIAAEINQLHAELNGLAKNAVEKAIRIGQLLTEQHAKCQHGEWMPWFKSNVQFSLKTGDNYRRIFRERDKIVNITNLTEAYRITLPKADKNGEKPVIPPREREQERLVIDLYSAGKPLKEIAAEAGINSRRVDEIVREEKIRQSVEPQITPEMLSMSAREKFDRAIRQAKERLGKQFRVAVIDEVERQVNSRLEGITERWHKEQEMTKLVMNRRRGVMTKRDYNKILSCLHPDWVTDPKQHERYAEAFRIFRSLEKCFLNEKESPTQFVPLPKTRAEWDAMKQKATEARKKAREDRKKADLAVSH